MTNLLSTLFIISNINPLILIKIQSSPLTSPISVCHVHKNYLSVPPNYPRLIIRTRVHAAAFFADKWKHCIFVFDHKGELVRRMCDRGQGESQLRSPEGITFHPERSVLYVADTGNDRVQILGTDGAYVSSIGPAGKGRAIDAVRIHRTGPSQLNQPTDVAVTTTRVVVADSGSHKIKVTPPSPSSREVARARDRWNVCQLSFNLHPNRNSKN